MKTWMLFLPLAIGCAPSESLVGYCDGVRSDADAQVACLDEAASLLVAMGDEQEDGEAERIRHEGEQDIRGSGGDQERTCWLDRSLGELDGLRERIEARHRTQDHDPGEATDPARDRERAAENGEADRDRDQAHRRDRTPSAEDCEAVAEREQQRDRDQTMDGDCDGDGDPSRDRAGDHDGDSDPERAQDGDGDRGEDCDGSGNPNAD